MTDTATTTTAAEVPRLKRRYNDEVRSALQEQLGLGNVMQVPTLEKIVLNMGVGAAVGQASLLERAVADLTVITGQKPLVTRAKKSIAGFKLREGNAIGAKVTLRGNRMWEFFDRSDQPGHSPHPRLPWLAGEQLRWPRQLHVRDHRAADLSRD